MHTMNDYGSESPKPTGSHNSWSHSPSEEVQQSVDREAHWRHFDNSVNAVSFGFVATAILISMFLMMAIFERFLRPRSSFSSAQNTGNRSVESIEVRGRMQLLEKLEHLSTDHLKGGSCNNNGFESGGVGTKGISRGIFEVGQVGKVCWRNAPSRIMQC